MPAKKKAGRGKTLNIVEFNDDFVPEDNLDWAAEVPPEEKTDEQILSEKLAKRDYSRIANNALAEKDGFRSAPSAQVTRLKSVEDLQPPFVAHFGNLRNGMTQEDFLRNFHEDVIENSRLINQDGKSFAFVEFKSAEALLVALTMDQTMVRGRKLYVDLATQKQIDRMQGNTTGLSRQSAGQSQQNLHNLNLTRDAFGTTQSEKDFTGGRSGFSSRNDLHALGELSRDMLGTAARASDGSPSPTGPPDFANWRSDGPASQPEFQSNQLRDNRRSDAELEKRGGHHNNNNNNNNNNFRHSKHQSPVGQGGLASWRDEPVAQPNSTGPATPADGGEIGRKGFATRTETNNTRSGAGSGGPTRGQTRHQQQQQQQQQPRDDSKWEALRR